MRALVADDIPANIRLLEARLSAEGIDVVTARNGGEAVEICAREPVDVVLLDVMMPGVNGFEACRRIKANPESRRVPVVLVTALDEQSDRLSGIAAGADDFLTKPVDDVALLTRVRTLASLKLAQDDVSRRTASPGYAGDAQVADGAHILAIDPNPRALERISAILGSAYKLTLAPDVGAEWRKSNNQSTIDLVLVATPSPSAGKLEPCSRTLRPQCAPDAPIIAMVESADPMHVSCVLERGADDFVAKPVDRHELRSRVSVLLRRKHLLGLLRSRPLRFSAGG